MLNRGKRILYSQKTKGFALPAVLIASIVMFLVLLASVTAAVSVRTSLNDQYYNRMAQNAADAGLEYAKACVKKNLSANWGSLEPNTGCDGADNGSDRYMAKIKDENEVETLRITFKVECTKSCDNENAINYLNSIGTIELLRNEGTAGEADYKIWRLYSANSSYVGVDITIADPPEEPIDPLEGPITAKILLVGGGGGGSGDVGGGGGGGEVLKISDEEFEKEVEYNVTVGAGGNRGSNSCGGQGGHSSVIGGFIDETAYGGGGGGVFKTDALVKPGTYYGSIGGGGGGYPGQSGFGKSLADPMYYQGYLGGDGISGYTAAGGGGGASSVGGNALSDNIGGAGGEGCTSNITGVNKCYGGGGGGGGGNGSGGGLAGKAHPDCGGGDGEKRGSSNNAQNGLMNRGGGGGGHGFATDSYGGNGGSGVVIIQFDKISTDKIETDAACNNTDDGTKTYCTFISDGSIKFK